MSLANVWRNKTERYGELNTHDVIKCIALVTMTIDHVGAYCFPDQLWLRAIGRIHVPIWFFLAGHARTHSVPAELLWLAALIAVAQPWLQQSVFPLNVLVSIAACRVAVRYVEQKGWLTRYPGELGSICFMLWLPSIYVFEYGSVAVAIALWGAMIRLYGSIPRTQKFAVFCALLYAATQVVSDDYTMLQAAFIAVGSSITCGYLQHFTIHPVWEAQQHTAWVRAMRFISRQSLYYYAVHRLALQAVGAYLLLTGKVPEFSWVVLTP